MVWKGRWVGGREARVSWHGCRGRERREGVAVGKDAWREGWYDVSNGRYGVEERVKGMEGAEGVTHGRYASESYCKEQLLRGQCFELTL